MSAIVTMEEAQAKLKELIHQLAPGEEIVITEHQQPVAKLMSEQPKPKLRPGPGLCKGMITIVADDDEHLKDFAEYMQRQEPGLGKGMIAFIAPDFDAPLEDMKEYTE